MRIMNRKNVFIFIILLSWSSSRGQFAFTPHIDSLIQRGIDQTFSCQFDSAMTTFHAIAELAPDHPVGYFYMAATYQSMMMHYETDRWRREFYDLVDEAVDIGKNRLKDYEEDAWAEFYLGSSHNYRGLFKVKNGGLVPGFISARKGLGHLKNALEQDSTLYDAYLGLGSFDYWSGRFYKYLDWLPWIGDERERGIQRVRLAVEKSTFSYWVGVSSLAWIEYDSENYEEALRLFRHCLDRFPGSRFFMWGVADTYFRLHQFDMAVDTYEAILESIMNDSYNNGYNEIVCRFKLVRNYLRLSRHGKALEHCDAILGKQLSRKISDRVAARRDKTKEYRKMCLDELEKKNNK